jgi:hypothetical protein
MMTFGNGDKHPLQDAASVKTKAPVESAERTTTRRDA